MCLTKPYIKQQIFSLNEEKLKKLTGEVLEEKNNRMRNYLD